MAFDVAACQVNISNTIKFLESLSAQMYTRIPTMVNDLIDAGEGENFGLTLQQVNGFRDQVAGALSVSLGQNMLAAQIDEYRKLLGLPSGTSVLEILREITASMVAGTLSVNSRNLTYGSISAAGGNVSNGVILRLTKDENNNNIESIHVEAKTAEVLTDQNTDGSNRYEEILRITGVPQLDSLNNSKGSRSGIVNDVVMISEDTPLNLLTNPSFSEWQPPSGTLTEITGWTVTTGVIGSITMQTGVVSTNYYRSLERVPTTSRASIRFSGLATISQPLGWSSSGTRKLNPRSAYLATFAYNIRTAPTGTVITVTIGSKSQAFTLNSGDTGWRRLYIDLDTDLWYKNFYQDEGYFRIGVTTLASGYIDIDEVLLLEMPLVDTLPTVVIGGSTPAKIGDSWSWTDSVSTEGLINKWFSLLYGWFFPHNNSGAETWVDPTLP
jgi:hypothetical protein